MGSHIQSVVSIPAIKQRLYLPRRMSPELGHRVVSQRCNDSGYRGTSGHGQSVRDGWVYEFTVEGFYPPLTAPAVKPATIWRCAKTVSNSTGSVTISAAAASGPQLSWSKEIML